MRVAEAIARCLHGDQAAYRVVVDTYADELVGFVARLVGNLEDGRDLGQEAFVRAYRNLHRYDPERPFKPWLFRLARNLAYSHLKATASRPDRRASPLIEEAISSPESETQSPARAVWRSERRHAVDAVLSEMRPQFREVLLLRYMHHMDYEELAAAMGVPLGTVKTWLHRAKRQFRGRSKGLGVF